MLSKTFEHPDKYESVEVSTESQIVIEQVAKRISTDGGAALIIDYGEDRPSPFSLRAIRAHKAQNVLAHPGTTDLSVNVDFSLLKRASLKATDNKLSTWGPVPQGSFLLQMGIVERLNALLEKASERQQSSLIAGYERLVDPEQMGLSYKVLGITSFAGQPYGLQAQNKETE
jgi:NADH dehydrogenase [ubiquinone] 1 alpha subcomplex assembly factor 7